MKQFIKTLPGKTILFLCCIVCFCLLLGSLLGLVFYAENDFSVYTEREQTFIRTEVEEEIIRPSGHAILWDALLGLDSGPNDGFGYWVTNEEGQVVAAAGDFPDGQRGSYTLAYSVRMDEEGVILELGEEGGVWSTDGDYNQSIAIYTIELWPLEGSNTARRIDLLTTFLHLAYGFRHWIYIIGLSALLLTIATFVALMYAAARRPDSEELHPGALHKVPFDLLVLLCGIVAYGMLVVTASMALGYVLYPGGNEWLPLFAAVAFVLLGSALFLGLAMSVAGRVKTHTLVQNTVMHRIWGLLKAIGRFLLSLLRSAPLAWKTVLTACGMSLVYLIAIATGDLHAMFVVWLLGSVLLIPGALYLALVLRRLQKGGAALASGNLDYQTDTKGMLWDFKQHGEHLNRIAGITAAAVEERMKSERMKTELITNVSHDIKTPLTSIINYATLIGEAPETSETVSEYAGVLVRQSDKLKRLIEDLVEASRASTGNLEVLLAPCDPAVFLTQASGEYAEKLAEAKLTLVTKQSEQELRVLADGRRMWRIFDNLMNNVCKYAQPCTRVYLSLETQGGEAVMTLKNTSQEPLNLSVEELMERFSRGDASRHTEGNGLGLAIARSMAELQGGRLELAVDGDLFKAILRFPLVEEVCAVQKEEENGK